MKTNAFVTFFIQILILQNIYSQKPVNAEITYIGNEGFMIENNGKKLLVDALYEHYEVGYGVVSVDKSLENLILTGSGPFSNIQLIMVSHGHPDHYNTSKVQKFITNNPSSKLVYPSKNIELISDTALQQQIISVSPDKYTCFDTTVNDIPLSVYNLRHFIKWGSSYNSGYYVDLDGLKIFHGGDNVVEDTTEVINYRFYEKNIDIAFFNLGVYETQWKIDFIKKYINPKQIILMHVAPEELSEKKENFKKYFPHVFVFNSSMERVKYTDSLSFENRMPEKVMDVSDTTLIINTPCEFKLPNVFNDPDTNDSLTYSMTGIYTAPGLPTGLSFDREKMIISGTPTKAGKVVGVIKATDKSLCSNSTSFNITVENVASTVNENQTFINVYPIVFSNEIHVTNLSSKSVISIFTIDGILLKTIQTQEPSVQIDFSYLINGPYIVRVENMTYKYSKLILKCLK